MAFSSEDNFVIVNYHYVENPRVDFSGIYPCAVEEFERQIAFLSQNFSIVSIPELYNAATHGEKKKLCAITFDDGLKDQYDNAIPILKKYNAPATFFIITGTIDGRVPLAHKIHIVSSRVSMDDIAEKFNAFLLQKFPDSATYFIPKDRRITDGRRHDGIISANVKETLTIVPHVISDAFLACMLNECAIDEKELSRKLFMSSREIQALENDGFFVGSHTHVHYALSTVDADVQRGDFHASKKVFKDILGRSPTIMAYPYGRWPEMDTILHEYGFTHGVTVEPQAVSNTDIPLRIPRFDTKDVKIFLDKH